MPKLTSHTFRLETEDRELHEFYSEIHVSTDGEFSCTVPEYLVDAINSIGKSQLPGRYAQKLKTKFRAFAPSKAELLSLVDEAHRQYHQAEVSVDFIICYDWFAEVNYWQNPDGSMTANGAMPDAAKRNDRDGSGGNWAEHRLRNGQMICANNTAEHFSVGVYASVHTRTTYKRVSGQTVVWARVSQFDSRNELGEWGQKLAGICGLSAPKSEKSMQQMPYSEESARFFYESMMAMCEIGRRFKAFFGDQQNIVAAIEGVGPALLARPLP